MTNKLSEDERQDATKMVLTHLGNLTERVQGDATDKRPVQGLIVVELLNEGDYRMSFSGFANRALAIGALEETKLAFREMLLNVEAGERIQRIVAAAEMANVPEDKRQ